MSELISIDGSQGEGGGQILRSALALSLATGKPFRIERVRAGRDKPGLMRQHLTCVTAACEISDAEAEGDSIGSQTLTFAPGRVKAGAYRFAVGTAGSATLVLQTVLPALMLAEGESVLSLEGGTHNPWAPPFDFLQKSFLPLLGRMGPQVEARLVRPGFYPAGGGAFEVKIRPVPKLAPLSLIERGPFVRRLARACVANLPTSIAKRELVALAKALGLGRDEQCVEEAQGSVGPGNVVMVELESKALVEVVTGFGERGVSAERVAANVAAEARELMASPAPVGRHLADQLLLPCGLCGEGRFRTVAITRHTTTNIDVVTRFLPVRFDITRIEKDCHEITVQSQN
jgi:RNA 3'-terminal phosphate cyclase (ATP)